MMVSKNSIYSVCHSLCVAVVGTAKWIGTTFTASDNVPPACCASPATAGFSSRSKHRWVIEWADMEVSENWHLCCSSYHCSWFTHFKLWCTSVPCWMSSWWSKWWYKIFLWNRPFSGQLCPILLVEARKICLYFRWNGTTFLRLDILCRGDWSCFHQQYCLVMATFLVLAVLDTGDMDVGRRSHDQHTMYSGRKRGQVGNGECVLASNFTLLTLKVDSFLHIINMWWS